MGFGGFGSLADEAALRVPNDYGVARLRISSPDRYRIDYVIRTGKSRLKAFISDGEQRWRILDEEVRVGPTVPPAITSPLTEIANLFDPSWLLESRLTGGTETVIGGRRGYRLAVASDNRRWPSLISPDEVVVDAELGFLLGTISHAAPPDGSAAVAPARATARSELRDVITGYSAEPGDFQPDLPPGTPVVEEDPDHYAMPDPAKIPRAMAEAVARKAAKEARSAVEEARSAVEGFVDFIRGGAARLPQDDADDLAGDDDQASHLIRRVAGMAGQ
jgi:hypothetical protein